MHNYKRFNVESIPIIFVANAASYVYVYNLVLIRRARQILKVDSAHELKSFPVLAHVHSHDTPDDPLLSTIICEFFAGPATLYYNAGGSKS